MSASASTSAQLQVVDGVALTEIFKGLTSTSEERDQNTQKNYTTTYLQLHEICPQNNLTDITTTSTRQYLTYYMVKNL